MIDSLNLRVVCSEKESKQGVVIVSVEMDEKEYRFSYHHLNVCSSIVTIFYLPLTMAIIELNVLVYLDFVSLDFIYFLSLVSQR